MTRLMRTALAAVLCMCAVTVSAQAPASRFARSPEAGGLALRNYPPEVYDGGGQNWMTLQDATGILYVALAFVLMGELAAVYLEFATGLPV